MADVSLTLKAINVVTYRYNMHGFNQGCAMLLDLSLSFDVIFGQEHWLSTDQLYKLNAMTEDFRCFSVCNG